MFKKLKKPIAFILTIKDPDIIFTKFRNQSFDKFFDLRVISGVTPEKLNISTYFHAISLSNSKRIISPGEYCCALGHSKIYEIIIKEEMEGAYIFEDDISFDFEQKSMALEGFIEWTKLNQDKFCILGGQNGLLSYKYLIGKVVNSFDGMLLSVVHPKIAHLLWRTCCYYISHDLALMALSCHRKKATLADDWRALININDINAYYIDLFSHPSVLNQSSLESDRLIGTKKLKSHMLLETLNKAKHLFLQAIFYFRGYRRLKKPQDNI